MLNHTMEELLRAITERRVVHFRYGGFLRVGEPHVLGMYRGAVQLLFYQTGGRSSSGQLPEWRRFNLSGISRVSLEDQRFPGGRASPSGQHAKWDERFAFVP